MINGKEEQLLSGILRLYGGYKANRLTKMWATSGIEMLLEEHFKELGL